MIRLIVRTTDIGAAANVGGPVHESFKTFTLEYTDLEGYLREHSDNKWMFRQVIGAEVVENSP